MDGPVILNYKDYLVRFQVRIRIIILSSIGVNITFEQRQVRRKYRDRRDFI